jgi:hypothetical protein
MVEDLAKKMRGVYGVSPREITISRVDSWGAMELHLESLG